LLKGVCEVLEKVGIDKSKVHEGKQTLIDAICHDPTMLADPSWNEAENNTPVRKNFATFFGRMKG